MCPQCGTLAATIVPAPTSPTSNPAEPQPGSVAQFVMDRCELRPGAATPARDFRFAYIQWATTNGHSIQSYKRLAMDLTRIGGVSSNRKSGGVRVYTGIALKS